MRSARRQGNPVLRKRLLVPTAPCAAPRPPTSEPTLLPIMLSSPEGVRAILAVWLRFGRTSVTLRREYVEAPCDPAELGCRWSPFFRRRWHPFVAIAVAQLHSCEANDLLRVAFEMGYAVENGR